MKSVVCLVLLLSTTALTAYAASAASPATAATEVVPVTVDNFVRAETDLYFSRLVMAGALGRLRHRREPARVDQQTVIRLNRDTLYSSGVFDLDAGPVTVAMPDAGNRYISMQVIDEDHYTHDVFYGRGTHTLNRNDIGTRYVMIVIRTLVDTADPKDIESAHRVQDAIEVEQKGGSGSFLVPNWDQVSQKKVRDALLVLASTLPDTKGMFGKRGEVDPVRRLAGAASAWGGLPEKETLYLNVVPEKNDGKTVYRLNVKDVPVKGFWSVSVYNEQGYYEPNAFNAYNLNNITATKGPDGSVTVQFGGCDGKIPNCLPIMEGWNYMVRLYIPSPEVVNGTWKFPVARPANAQ
jgi:hypothetical protein